MNVKFSFLSSSDFYQSALSLRKSVGINHVQG